MQSGIQVQHLLTRFKINQSRKVNLAFLDLIPISMNKPIAFTLLFLIAICFQLFPQSSFEVTISNVKDQIINSVVENYESGFVLVGRIHHFETGLPGGYILKVDCNGSLLLESIIQPDDSTSYQFFNIHYFNNYYYVLGSKSIVNTDKWALWFLMLNSELEVASEKLLYLPTNKWISYMNSIIDSDSNIMITGYTTHYDTISPYNNDPFYVKLSITGDSINSVFFSTSSHWDRPFDLIESKDSANYHIFYSYYDNTSSGQMVTINKNFELLNVLPIPKGVHNYYSPVFINDTSFLICGAGTPALSYVNHLNVVSITEAGQLVNYNHFFINENMRDQPTMYQGVSKFGNNIYVGGTSNYDYTNPFFSSFNSWFHLIKINADLTPIWEYWYGDDAYYFLYSILATNDGGCIMVGNRYDYETQDQERDIYIVKVNNDGLIVWTQEIQTNRKLTKVFPNPGTSQLNIKTELKEFNFELINLNGQSIIKQMFNSDFNTINTESLKMGMYFYRIIDNKNELIETGKWIKY